MQYQNSILIVDDSRENIDALRGMLDGYYTVYVALNGEKALTILERANPDIVLLDLVMPGIDGFGVLERMKSNTKFKNIPVIFITSETDAFNEAKGLMLGAVDYITKPYNPDIVSIKVKNQIENKMHRDGLERLVQQRTKELTASREAIIMGMSLLAEGRDKGTGLHIMRMQKYTKILAQRMVVNYPELLTQTMVDNIVLFSPLHDIGKVCVPDAILLKKGRLTDEEFETIKLHTTFGADILKKTENFMQSNITSLSIAIEIAESHHEKYNGKGYPNRLAGDNIPLSARIVALTDIYDALTSEREYKAAFNHRQAFDILTKGDGRTDPKHFDPRVLKAFIDVSEEFETVI